MTDLENHQFPTNIIINSGKDHQSMLKPRNWKRGYSYHLTVYSDYFYYKENKYFIREKSGSNLISPIIGHIGIMGFILMYKCVKGLLILDIDKP